MNKIKLPMTTTQLTYEPLEEKGAASLNLCNGFLLKGNYDIERMKRAVEKLYERHDVLRMVMKKDSDKPYLVIDDNISLGLDVIELESSDRDSRYAEAMNDSRIRVRENIAFSNKGMYRFWAYEIADDELMIVYVANHCGTDGSSMAILNGEIEMLYENPDRTDIPTSSSFEDFLIERKSYINSNEYKKDGEYWKNLKMGCETVDIPLPEQKYDECIAMELGAYTVPLDKINKIARVNKTSNFNVVFLMLRLAIAELTKKKDISMTYIFASRMNPKYRGTFGFVAQGAVSRTKIVEDLTWKDTLKEVKNGMNEGLRHINSSDSVDFDEFLLSYMPKTSSKLKTTFADLECVPFVLHPVARFKSRLFAVIATEISNVLYLYPMCDVNVYGPEFIQAFNGIINRYTEMIVENPDITIKELIK